MSVANVKDRTRYQFHLMFQRSGLDRVAWRGVVDTPFFTIDPATPVVEEGK